MSPGAVSGAPRGIRLAFLGCGFITGVHSRHLRGHLDFELSYASREAARAEEFRIRHGGVASYDGYDAALADPRVDAVVVAVPPAHHRDLVLAALAAGKHVLVEKPAFPQVADYDEAARARDAADRVVLVGENDHYKPLAVTLRRLLAEGAIGDLVMAQFSTVALRSKTGDDWRNDEALAGGDAFFEEGVHWLHIAGSLGPRLVSAHPFRPTPGPASASGDRRARSMLVALTYDTGATGALFYSREIPAFLRGARTSQLFGRDGVITFESNGAFVAVHRAKGRPRVILPGVRDIRGYRAMYDDFARAIRTGSTPEMSLERAREDQVLMEQVRDG